MENTLENNRLIAEFMGAAPTGLTVCLDTTPGKSSRYYTSAPALPEMAINVNGRIINYVTGKELNYHSSWDELMPVVDKILSSQELDLGYPTYETEEALSVEDALLTRKIEIVCEAVIQFIQWYNENK